MLQDGSVDFLATVPLFAGAERQALESVIFMNSRQVYSAGEMIARAGEPCRGAHLIVYGKAAALTPDGQEVSEEYDAGSMLSEMAMFCDGQYEADIMALGVVQVVEISKDRMAYLLETEPALAELLASRIQERLHGIAERLRAVEHILEEIELPGFTDETEELTDQIPPEQAHDLTDASSPEPHQSPALNETHHEAPELPIHGPAVAHGWIGANPLHGNSTR